MFTYRPSKASIWGHAIRPNDPFKAKQAVNRFFETFFEKLEPEWDTSRQFTLTLSWRTSALPRIEWAAEFLTPESQQWQKVMFIVTGDRISVPMGLLFPISVTEPASYEFLRRFSAEAPFKMSHKNFQVGITGKSGKLAWRKPDADITARLQEVIV